MAYCVDLGYGAAVGAEMLSIMLFGGVVSAISDVVPDGAVKQPSILQDHTEILS